MSLNFLMVKKIAKPLRNEDTLSETTLTVKFFHLYFIIHILTNIFYKHPKYLPSQHD